MQHVSSALNVMLSQNISMNSVAYLNCASTPQLLPIIACAVGVAMVFTRVGRATWRVWGQSVQAVPQAMQGMLKPSADMPSGEHGNGIDERGVLTVDGYTIANPQLPLFKLFWCFGRWLHLDTFRQTHSGTNHLPLDHGCFLVATNHQSHLDCSAVFVGLWLGGVKRVYALGARDYFFKNPLKAWFVTTLMAVIPCSRRGFSRYEVDILKKVAQASSVDEPAAVVIFPEGTRSRTGKLQPFKDGVGYLSSKLDVPVVPAFVDGTFRALPKGRTIPHWVDEQGRVGFHVRFGRPLPPPSLPTTGTERLDTPGGSHGHSRHSAGKDESGPEQVLAVKTQVAGMQATPSNNTDLSAESRKEVLQKFKRELYDAISQLRKEHAEVYNCHR